MHSSWFPWDLKKNRPELISDKGFVALYCSDPYIERIALSWLPNVLKKQLHLKWAHEINLDWLENEYLGADLFGERAKYRILESEKLSKNVSQSLLEGNYDFEENFLLLSFSKKKGLYEKLIKQDFCDGLEVKEPPFWMSDKFFDFLCESGGIHIHFKTKEWILENIPHESSELMRAIKLVAMNNLSEFPGNSELEKILSPERIDIFKLSEIYTKKEFIKFYEEILAKKLVQDSYLSFFRFMQSHFIKLGDVSYIEKKKRPSKYDRTLKNFSKSWTLQEISIEIQKFSELEILSKHSPKRVLSELRNQYYSYMK